MSDTGRRKSHEEMSLLNAAELKQLLDQCKDVELQDKEGADDYAYLEETIFPTLLPALVKLLERLEDMGLKDGHSNNQVEKFNSIRWLAEYMVRYHPDGGVFKHDSAYADHLKSLAAMRKEQRTERELLVKEKERMEEEEKLRQELERTEEEEKAKQEREEQRKIEAEKKREEENEKGENAVLAQAGPEYGSVVLKLRGTMMRLLSDHDFISAESTAAIESKLCKEACQFLAVNSHASFTAVGELLDQDNLFYHTAADKKEFVADDDDEEEEELDGMPPAKKVPDPEITVRDLPAKEEDVAYILKRGNGLTFETVVDEGQYKFIGDTKYTEGVYFFEEKRPGTYIAVPLLRAGVIAGVICGDTLDSIAGAELVETEHVLFHAVSVVLSEALDKAVWSLMDAKRTVHLARLTKLASDPGTMPETIAREIVEAVDVVFPGHLVSVGVVDTVRDMRLVFSSARNGSRERNKTVTPDSKEEQVFLMFDAKQQCKTTYTMDTELTRKLAVAVPLIKGENRVSAVLYVGADPKTGSISEDVEDLTHQMAAIVSPILLPPEENALRVMRILALSGVGNSAALYEMAAQLCIRYTGATEVMVAMAHGVGSIRVVRVSKGGDEADGPPAPFKEELAKLDTKPACAEAMESLKCVTKGGWIAVPLVAQTGARADCVGVMGVQCAAVDQVQERTLEGVAVALTSAMQVSEMRRKMAMCGEMALESLLKRAPTMPAAYLAYLDVSGRQVCARVLGEDIPGVEVGKVIEDTEAVQTAAIKREGDEAVFGLIGVPASAVKDLEIAMHEESPWDTIKDVAATMGEVSKVLSGEGLMVDNASEATKEREELLSTHFNAARFDLVTAATVSEVDLKYIDAVRTQKPYPVVIKIVQAIMYILGHQERDVSEWPKCKKLVTHHLFKEMRMIDVRKPLKVHKLKLARACIEDLAPHDIALEVGPKPLAIWKWVGMILDVQGV